MTDLPNLQSTLQRTHCMLQTDVAPLRYSRSHRLPTSAYLNLERQACSSTPGGLLVMQHCTNVTTLVQLPRAWCGSPSKGRRCIMASAAPFVDFSDTAIVRFDKAAQLPPLVPSIVIPGLPPPPPPATWSQLHEANQRLRSRAERWGLPPSTFEQWSPTCISLSGALYGGEIDMDRLVAISSFLTIGGMLDDHFFEAPDASALKEYGISCNVCESPETNRAFFKHLDSLFRQLAPLPKSPTPMEGIIWELGQEMRRLSTPAYLAKLAYTLMEHLEGSNAIHADNVAGDGRRYDSNIDCWLEAFSQVRVRDSAYQLMVLLVEIACNAFLPDKFRAHPAVQQLADAAALHCAYVNDLISYSREVEVEPSNMHNLLMVLMDHQSGRLGDANSSGSLPEAAWDAVDLIKAQADRVTELEQQLFDLAHGDQPDTVELRTFIDGVKSAMAANFLWHVVAPRYQHPNSAFPELRGNVTT